MSEYEFCLPASYENTSYDSMTEARWAAYFDLAGMPYVHEPETFELSKKEWYTPDFFLPEQDTYVEVKNGNIDWLACSKFAAFIRRIGKTGLLLNGSPHGFAGYFFSPESENRSNLFKDFDHARNYADYIMTPREYGPRKTENGLTFSGMIEEMGRKAVCSISTEPHPELRHVTKERKRQLQTSRTPLYSPE